MKFPTHLSSLSALTDIQDIRFARNIVTDLVIGLNESFNVFVETVECHGSFIDKFPILDITTTKSVVRQVKGNRCNRSVRTRETAKFSFVGDGAVFW
jgi:hypothetical protein